MRPDFARAADLGVTSAVIAETLRVATTGDYDAQLPKLNLSQRQVPIAVKLEASARQDLAVLERLPVPGARGVGSDVSAAVASVAIPVNGQQTITVPLGSVLDGCAPTGECALVLDATSHVWEYQGTFALIYDCAGPPPVCGNGAKEGAEGCDDGGTVAGDASRSGEMYRSFRRRSSSAAKMASFSASVLAEVRAPASTPACVSDRTWSRISAISGEMTTVTPSRHKAGS